MSGPSLPVLLTGKCCISFTWVSTLYRRSHSNGGFLDYRPELLLHCSSVLITVQDGDG